ncbi:MAG: hypothetical protein F6K41_21815 [Symploca sp. SIO3E6]|nr:hypothetical protein [Caldora sp. SIO3E6]
MHLICTKFSSVVISGTGILPVMQFCTKFSSTVMSGTGILPVIDSPLKSVSFLKSIDLLNPNLQNLRDRTTDDMTPPID